MITINNVNYSSSTINLEFKQFQEISLESNSSNVVWEVIKYPYSSNNINYTPKFNYSNDIKSTHNPEKLKFEISGNYYIMIVERDIKGNYVRTQLYVQIFDVVSKNSIPITGETFEFNTLGWSKTIEKSIQQLNQKQLAKLIKGFCTTELNVTNLVYINSINEMNSSGFTFNINPIENYQDNLNIQLGIVVEKIDLTPELENEKIYIYVILLKGILNVGEDFTLDVDSDNRFYYNVENSILTDSIADSYVGRFFNTEKMILMESEIFYFGTYQDMFSSLLINP